MSNTRLTNYVKNAIIKAVMKDVPKIDYHEQIKKLVMDHFVEKLPPAVRRVWDNPETRCYINLGRAYLNYQYIHAPSRDEDLDVTPELMSKVAEIKALNDAQDEARNALREKLKGAVYACTTVKKFIDTLPEFEKYLPKTVDKPAQYPIAIANVVSDFMQAGWPKGGVEK